jgi:hypothetical protein
MSTNSATKPATMPATNNVSNKHIKSYLASLLINQHNIYYVENNEPKQITNIPEIKNWGTVNKMFFTKDGAIILNKKKIHFLQKKKNINIRIYKTNTTTYVSPTDVIFGENNSFEYKMDILVENKVVYSMSIDSSSFQTNDFDDIKCEMFKTFNFISEKCTFIILYLLS